ncbi:MAG: GTP 3',8-cyclase MoaA [Kiritimatiellia bacterium]
MALDQYHREIHYLRVSVTDACNLRCVYCMPESMSFRPGSALLQDDEILRLIRLFASLGFDKIRFTGGVPTLRSNIVGLVKGAAETPGVTKIGITTNGVLLDHLARPLREAGLTQVNVSLDTLDPVRFRQITRWGHLRDVLEGIESATRAGLPVKINAVVAKGLNDGQDVVDLARLTVERDWQVRFIEMMPFGGIADFQLAHSVGEETLRRNITAALGPLDLCDGGKLDGEARVYRLRGAKGALGFISPVSAPFCAACNRARLTADGMLRLCLLREQESDLRALLRGGADDDTLREAIRASIHQKPWGHGLATSQFATNRTMSEIGG